MTASVRLVDKPAGVTSHDVVARIKHGLPRGVRVGHAGTLDPFATGLLLILIGRATRTQRFFMGLDKEYLVTAKFGARSNTGDTEGTIMETGVVPEGDLELPTGDMLQTPPDFSAVRVGGRRAYELARAGEEVQLEARPITVSRFEELERRPTERDYLIRCSSGTYIRSLIADLGDAYCVSLRRTQIGPFDVPGQAGVELDLLAALTQILPVDKVDENSASLIGHGRPMETSREVGETVAIVGPNGLVAIGEVKEAGLLSSIAGFVG
ncbi:MAG: tRNA pseudouridine(55) synthase TruB [Actinomycetes bacterium]